MSTKNYSKQIPSALRFLQGKVTDLSPKIINKPKTISPSSELWMQQLQAHRETQEQLEREAVVESAETLQEKANWRP